MRNARSCLRTVSRASSGVAATCLLALPAVVCAQVTAPPAPSLNRSPPAWIGYLLIMVLLGMVVGVSLLPSKRGHQD